MPTYLYGLILSRNAARVPSTGGIRGIDRQPIRAVACDALAAIVSTIEAAPSRQDHQAIVCHDVGLTGVVGHAITALASRFGQTFADDDALCTELASSPGRERHIATLERYDGYGEMRILMREAIEPAASARGSERGPIPTAEAPGRAYLDSLRDQRNPRPPLDFRAVVGDLILAERVERRGNVRTVSHLVPFNAEAKYRAELSGQPALVSAMITGPHALYTFAEPS